MSVHHAGYRQDIKATHWSMSSVSLAICTQHYNTMKMIIAFSALVAVAVAAPQNRDAEATVLRYDSDNIGVDGYNFAYETSNGISQQEQGQLQNAGSENESISVRGQFSYTGADGVVYTVTYIADENGFQPQGAHLPQA